MNHLINWIDERFPLVSVWRDTWQTTMHPKI